jgi:hypothetical protein
MELEQQRGFDGRGRRSLRAIRRGLSLINQSAVNSLNKGQVNQGEARRLDRASPWNNLFISLFEVRSF